MKKIMSLFMVFALLVCSADFSFAATKNQANLTTAQIDQLNEIGAPTAISSSRGTQLGTALNDIIVAAAGDGATGDTTTSIVSNGRFPATSLTLNSSSTGGTLSSVPYTILLKYVAGAGTSVDNAPGMTLPNGVPGQTFVVQIIGLMTGGTFIITPTTKTGYTSVTFDTKGDQVTFVYDGTLGWIVTANNGATLNVNT